jgi:hypothetical protein
MNWLKNEYYALQIYLRFIDSKRICTFQIDQTDKKKSITDKQNIEIKLLFEQVFEQRVNEE